MAVDRLVDIQLVQGKLPVLLMMARPVVPVMQQEQGSAVEASCEEGTSDEALAATLHALPFTTFPTTWIGIQALVDRCYPAVAPALRACMPAFRDGGAHAFADAEAAATPPQRFTPSDERPWGFWALLSAEGRANGAYFGYDEACAVLKAGKTLAPWQVRAFLYCALRLNGHFAGTGRAAHNADGSPGPAEYLMANGPMGTYTDDSSSFFGQGGILVDLASTACIPAHVLAEHPTAPYVGRFR